MGAGPIEIRRGFDATRRWELVTPRLSAGLEQLVLRCCGYRERIDSPVVRVEMPVSSIVLDIGLGGEPLVVRGAPMPQGFVAGLTDEVCPQHVGTSQEGIQLFLTPSGAAVVCGISSAELAADVIRFDALGAAQREIASRLREATSWQRRFALLDAWLRDRIERRAQPNLVERTVAALRDGTRPRLEVIARKAGCSTRHLSRVFATEVGMPPKAYARLARFGRFVSRLRKDETISRAAPTWASLAAELGFADQAHLIRDVRHFSGTTPALLARRLEVFAPVSGAARDR
jgi:AraC-like DNA-binding protein